MATGIEYVDCIAVNTDIQHLSYTHADHKILIGENITKGYGAGSKPEEFPVNACHGSQYGGGCRHLSGSRDIPGYVDVISAATYR